MNMRDVKAETIPETVRSQGDLGIEVDLASSKEGELGGMLYSMEELETVINLAIEGEVSIGLFIEMPGFELPELITNPYMNLGKKLEYYKNTYGKDLEHKHAKGIKIIGYTF